MKDSAHNSMLKAALDGQNPHSLVAFVEGDAFEKAVKKVPTALWELDEAVLKDRAKPTKTDYALRLALWNEFRLASHSGQLIKASRIYEGVCTYQHWYNNVLSNPEKLAWLLFPLQEYEQSLEPLLARIAERYDEIINMNVYDAKGRPVPALVKLVLQAMESVEGRLRGAAVQRIESKSLNVSVGVPSLDSSLTTADQVEAMRLELADLERRNRVAQNLPAINSDDL